MKNLYPKPIDAANVFTNLDYLALGSECSYLGK